ncbi:MAG: hypothetical protein SFX73_27460 [Kofleriaceae bacterium]|nr:hypothetical protein [Kofleriaceae bacterium]
MRSLMVAAALALTSLVAQPVADACGGSYDSFRPRIKKRAPALFLVAPHAGSTFVLLNQPVDEKAHTWRRLERRSYDDTMVAPAPMLASPVEITLVGPGGTKIVSARKQVLVKEAFLHGREPTVAMYVPAGEFRIAVLGAHAGYAWHELELVETARTGTKKRHAETELLTTFNETTRTYETQVKQRGWWAGSGAGIALGVITADGIRYAVLQDGAALTTISLGATATPRA